MTKLTKLAIPLVLGLIAWTVLAALPGQNYHNGRPYLAVILALAFCLGAIMRTSRIGVTSSMGVALCLIAPALALAWWTAPRDDAGFWILWFPILILAIGPTALCHMLGAAVRSIVAGIAGARHGRVAHGRREERRP